MLNHSAVHAAGWFPWTLTYSAIRTPCTSNRRGKVQSLAGCNFNSPVSHDGHSSTSPAPRPPSSKPRAQLPAHKTLPSISSSSWLRFMLTLRGSIGDPLFWYLLPGAGSTGRIAAAPLRIQLSSPFYFPLLSTPPFTSSPSFALESAHHQTQPPSSIRLFRFPSSLPPSHYHLIFTTLPYHYREL